jgi:hypothetical protein
VPNQQPEILEKIIFVALIMSLFADIILRSAWNKTYFTIGVPIFVMHIPIKAQYKGIPFQYLFEEEFQSSWPFLPPFAFKKIDFQIFGFREKFFQIRSLYIPLMHGLIIFENDKKRVVVKGIANWFTLWLILYLSLTWFNLLISFPVHITGSTTFIILLLGIFYSIQYFRFSKVCKFAAEMCSTKHFLNSDGSTIE